MILFIIMTLNNIGVPVQNFFLTLPYNCSSLSCWIKNTFTFYPLPLLPGRRLSQLELHLAMNHRIYLASVKQVLLNTCPKPDEKRLNAM